MDAEQHKESEREKIMPGRRRGIVVGWRGVQYLCHLVQYLCQPLSKPIWNSQFEISSPNSSNGVGTVILIHFWRLRASFTNSLHKRKLSFGIKIVLSGFTKDAQSLIKKKKLRWKGVDTVTFLRLILLNMYFELLVKLLAYVQLFNAPKKHVLNYFGLEMDAICC